MKLIVTKRANTGTVAMLCNTSIYSITESDEGQQRANEGPMKGQQRATNNKETKEQGNTIGLFDEQSDDVPPPKKQRFNPMNKRIAHQTPEMRLIGSCFGKPEEVVWTNLESSLLKNLAPTLEEITLIKEFYSYDIPETNGFRNRNVKTLLQNWPAQLINAREFFAAHPELKTA